MAELLQFGGHIFGCGPNLSDPMVLESASSEDIEVRLSSGSTSVNSTLWMLANMTYTKRNEVHRISPVLLHRLAQATASIKGTVPTALYTSTAIPLSTASWFSPANRAHSATFKGCTSPYHVRDGPKDSRFRRRCIACASKELRLHQMTWPTMATIKANVLPWFYDKLCRALKNDVRHRLMKAVVGGGGHDLELVHTKATNRVIALVSPVANTIFKIRRSTLRELLQPGLELLGTRGWHYYENLRSNSTLNLEPFILRHKQTLFLADLKLLVIYLATQRPRFILTAPGHPKAINRSSWREIAAASTREAVYGWRAWDKTPKFETILALGVALGCKLEDVGPDHFSATSSQSRRRELLAEAEEPWSMLEDVDVLIEALVDASVLQRSDSGGLSVANRRVPQKNCKRRAGHASAPGADANAAKEFSKRKKKRAPDARKVTED